ncbi:MAG: hypothetical protein ACLFPE_14935 [Bacteroidales bacterium]
MKKLTKLVLLAAFLIPIPVLAQQNFSPSGDVMVITAKDIADFTIVDSDGQTWNLYEQLNNGKTVVLDLFFTT